MVTETQTAEGARVILKKTTSQERVDALMSNYTAGASSNDTVLLASYAMIHIRNYPVSDEQFKQFLQAFTDGSLLNSWKEAGKPSANAFIKEQLFNQVKPVENAVANTQAPQEEMQRASKGMNAR